MKKARALKPEGVKIFPDFAKCTFERRALQRDGLIAARAQGKVAYFVMDKLVIKKGQYSFGRQVQGRAGSRKESPRTVMLKSLLTLADALLHIYVYIN